MGMRKVAAFLSVSACIVMLPGCKPGQPSLVGKREGEIEIPKSTGTDAKDPMNKFGEEFAKSMAKAMKMSLELKENNEFSMTMMFFPVEGTWAQAGDTITLKPTKIMGMDADQVKEAKAKRDGNQLASNIKVETKTEDMVLKIQGDQLVLEDPKKAKEGRIVFTRAKS